MPVTESNQTLEISGSFLSGWRIKTLSQLREIYPMLRKHLSAGLPRYTDTLNPEGTLEAFTGTPRQCLPRKIKSQVDQRLYPLLKYFNHLDLVLSVKLNQLINSSWLRTVSPCHVEMMRAIDRSCLLTTGIEGMIMKRCLGCS